MNDNIIGLVAILVVIGTPIAARIIIKSVFPLHLDAVTVFEFNEVLQKSFIPVGILATILHMKMKQAKENNTFSILENCNNSFLEKRFLASCDWDNNIRVHVFKTDYIHSNTTQLINFVKFAFINKGPYSCSERNSILKVLSELKASEFYQFSQLALFALNIIPKGTESDEFAQHTGMKSYPHVSQSGTHFQKQIEYPGVDFPLITKENYYNYLDNRVITKENNSTFIEILNRSNSRSEEHFYLDKGRIVMLFEHTFFSDDHVKYGLSSIYKKVLKKQKARDAFLRVLSKPYNGVYYTYEENDIKFKPWGFVQNNYIEVEDTDLKTIENLANNVVEKDKDFEKQLKAILTYFEQKLQKFISISCRDSDFMSDDLTTNCNNWKDEIELSFE